MRGILVRVGIDQTPEYGGWNAPVNTETRRFIFVPIRDSTYNNTGYIANGTTGGQDVDRNPIPAGASPTEEAQRNRRSCGSGAAGRFQPSPFHKPSRAEANLIGFAE
jgi:hypothetical protein